MNANFIKLADAINKLDQQVGQQSNYFDSKVGIGTMEPESILHLKTNDGSILFNIENSAAERGAVGIELNSSQGKWVIHADDDSNIFRIIDGTTSTAMLSIINGNVGIGTQDPRFKLDISGSIGANSTRVHSDIRWKKNIETIPSALNTVLQLRGVKFEWRADEYEEMNFAPGKHLGLIAQEVEAVIPEVVSTDEDGYKAVEYSNLTAVLIEAVKEQQEMIEQQQKAIYAIQRQMESALQKLEVLTVAQQNVRGIEMENKALAAIK